MPMTMPKPSDADRQRFTSLVPEAPGVEVKPMFGNLAAFVNGNMFMGLFGSEIGVKLPPVEAEGLRAEHGAGPFGPPERPMGGYVTLPASLFGTAEGTSAVAAALEHVSAAAPKRKK